MNYTLEGKNGEFFASPFTRFFIRCMNYERLCRSIQYCDALNEEMAERVFREAGWKVMDEKWYCQYCLTKIQ